jgi:short-subunit dehydrogenase
MNSSAKHAVIIGATSGIGRELAKLLVQDGFKVVVTGRRKALLDELAEESSNYVPVCHDVTEIDSLPEFFDMLTDTLPSIDLIVYSSGIGGANIELDWKTDLPTLQTNILAATRCYMLAYNLFRKQGHGHLVGLSSIASIRGNRHVPAYFASKSYQASFLESLWMKGKRSKADICVTDVQPGFVDTAMAIGDTFWMADVRKASRQIYRAIKRKKKKVYITKRWRLIAWVLKIVPASLIVKFT